MTIQLQLEPDGVETLRQEAAGLGLSVEELATDIIRRHVRARPAPDAAFRAALADSVRENEELLRRLAR